MKKIRSLTIMVGLSLALLALGTAGVKAQAIPAASFAGSFTLPFEAQWGPMTLPAGDYTLRYGNLEGVHMVEVVGKKKGSPHGLIMVQARDLTAAGKNSLICARQGDVTIVRALEMPVIGETVEFANPHGVRLLALQMHRGTIELLAETPILYQKIPVTLNQK